MTKQRVTTTALVVLATGLIVLNILAGTIFGQQQPPQQPVPRYQYGTGAQPQQLGERQARAEGADLEEVTPRHAVAEALLATPDREHDSPPCGVRACVSGGSAHTHHDTRADAEFAADGEHALDFAAQLSDALLNLWLGPDVGRA